MIADSSDGDRRVEGSRGMLFPGRYSGVGMVARRGNPNGFLTIRRSRASAAASLSMCRVTTLEKMYETGDIKGEGGRSISNEKVFSSIGDGGSGGRLSNALYAFVCFGRLARVGGGRGPVIIGLSRLVSTMRWSRVVEDVCRKAS